MVNFNANIGSATSGLRPSVAGIAKGNAAKPQAGFAESVKAIEKQISSVDDHQQSSDASIKDLLTGKNEDITAVVASVAKADMSFKLLVGVRNKLIEAYKQTMNMQL